MKVKIIATLGIIAILLMACKTQYPNQVNLKHELIKDLIHATKATSAKSNGKIIILKTQYCQDFDCEAYFQDYQEQIQIYSREDAFMRGISDYLEIETIDEVNGRIKLIKRAGEKFEKMEIKL